MIENKNSNWRATRVDGLLGLSKTFLDEDKTKILHGCWRSNKESENHEIIDNLLEARPPMLAPSHQLKFLDESNPDITPLATLGIFPDADDFKDMRVKKKVEVYFLFIFYLSIFSSV